MWPYPKVIAHRGAGTLAPENTIAAMQCGLDYGFRAVEFDVMLSKDGVPVLMHDPLFGRTVTGVGAVATTLAADLLQMDAGSWFSDRFAGESVPSYENVFRFCQQNGIWMNVEIKPVPGFEKVTGQTVARVSKELLASGGNLPLFSSFSLDALMCAKEEASDIPRSFLIDQIDSGWLSALQDLDAVALHTNQKYLTKSMTAEIKANGYGLMCYTVNTRERATEICAWGVDGFCTDRIDLIPSNF